MTHNRPIYKSLKHLHVTNTKRPQKTHLKRSICLAKWRYHIRQLVLGNLCVVPIGLWYFYCAVKSGDWVAGRVFFAPLTAVSIKWGAIGAMLKVFFQAIRIIIHTQHFNYYLLTSTIRGSTFWYKSYFVVPCYKCDYNNCNAGLTVFLDNFSFVGNDVFYFSEILNACTSECKCFRIRYSYLPFR